MRGDFLTDSMDNISAIILTNNSEEVIADCIDSVTFCGEIIVVDDSSSDRTKELAEHLGAKVFNFSSASFSEKRNFGLKKAKKRWVLYLDDDERVTNELKNNITEAASQKKTEFSGYRLKRKNFYLGNNEWPYIEKLERFFLKNSLEKWSGKLHETPVINGEVGDLDGFINHYTHRNLTEMVNKTIKWSETEAKLRLEANHPKMNVWRFVRVILTGFYNSYVLQGGYKAGTMGVVESIYQAFSMFITYARLWEMQNASNK